MNPSLELRRIELRVPQLDRSLAFYTEQLGFVLRHSTPESAELAAAAESESILTLRAEPGAAPAPHTAAGLFHAALLFPTRQALGAWLRGAAERGMDFDGVADHAVSEALYFTDPDGNGLEFYADRPRSAWPFVGSEVQMVTEPLDVPSLLAAGGSLPGNLNGAKWGHLHLRVTNLDDTERFYRDKLGLQVMQRNFPGARFLAADGYHHHLGTNVWGHPQLPQPANALGLASATFALRSAVAPQQWRDPDHIAINAVPLN